tara:strand:- start:660 stop:1817 length:1158 start_codon:yes stop_codon:yes gene_type:complete
MSNLEINPDLPLKEFKKQIPKHKYNDILKLRVLEADFDNTMEQYQRTFQTYLSYTQQQVEYEWRERYPVQVSNMNAIIDQRFPGNVTKDECFASCANDGNCKYVLWSDTGPSYCAPNKCKKFTTAGDSMISSNGIVEENPMCAADLLWSEVNAELENPLTGWEEFPELENQFPTETNYKYSGWEKPEWKKYGNSTTDNTSNPEWINLDDADSVDKCNQIAMDSSNGPFDWTLHNGNSCKGHKLGGQNVGSIISSNGSTLSQPPGGQTGMIVASRISTLNQLRALNSRLLNLMQQIYNIANSIYPKGIDNKEQSKYELKNIFQKNKRLLADRERIIELSGSLSDIESQNESLKLQHDANQLLYLGMSVLLVGVAGITYKIMSSKSN